MSSYSAENFSLQVDPQQKLEVLGPNGEKEALISAPTVGQKVRVGQSNFQVSYGRDTNQLLTTIVAPDSTHGSSNLTFGMGGNKIETDNQTVVTMVFSPDGQTMAIEPSTGGMVKVNDQKINQPVTAPVTDPSSLQAINNGASLLKKTSYPVANTDIQDQVPSPSGGQDNPSPATDEASKQQVFKGEQATPSELGNGQLKPFKGFVTEEEARESRLSIPNFPLLIGGLNRGSINDNITVQSVAGDKYVLLKDKMPELQQEVAKDDPGATIVPLNQFYASSENYVMVSPGNVGGSGDEVWLQHSAFWAEPVTPPNSKLAPAIAPDQIKLVEVKGPVEVTGPGGPTRTATEGMLISSGSRIETGLGGSAAVFFGGVNSARFAPNTNGTITQTISHGTRTTLVNIKTGCVFSKIGRRDGETQAFTIKTPGGVAKAIGTEVATNWTGTTMGVFTASGSVSVLDNNGNKVGDANSSWRGEVGMVTVPNLPETQRKSMLNEVLMLAQNFNSKINDLLSRRANSKNLSPVETAYLNNAPQIYYAVLARRFDLSAAGLTTPVSFQSNITVPINIVVQPSATTPF